MEKLIVNKKLETKSRIGIFTVRELFVLVTVGILLFFTLNLLVGLDVQVLTMLLYLLSSILLKVFYPSARKKIIEVLNPYIPSACYEGGTFKPQKSWKKSPKNFQLPK